MRQRPAKRTCRTVTDSIAAMVLSRHRRGNEIGPIGEAPTFSGRQERIALANRLKAVGIGLSPGIQTAAVPPAGASPSGSSLPETPNA